MIVWSELFPTKLSIVIFICYMSLFISQGILVTASQEKNNSYNYNTIAVVLLTEVLKLFTSVCFYLKGNSVISLFHGIKKDYNIMMLYFVPAVLYCLYNNLAFVSLSTFDPTTYYLLLQFRVVITGILFQIIFKKYLTKKQWISLIVLTLGCMIKQIDFEENTKIHPDQSIKELDEKIQKNTIGLNLEINIVFILSQIICSCLAGVYNEYLLKNKGSDVDLFLQNIFMYLNSILCNSVIFMLQKNVSNELNINKLKYLFHFNVIIIMINNAAIGIVTSFFLKYMNSILKTFASALELIFTAIFCNILFSIPIYLNTILSICVVSLAIYMYSQSPVVNKIYQQEKKNFIKDNERLLRKDNIDNV